MLTMQEIKNQRAPAALAKAAQAAWKSDCGAEKQAAAGSVRCELLPLMARIEEKGNLDLALLIIGQFISQEVLTSQ